MFNESIKSYAKSNKLMIAGAIYFSISTLLSFMIFLRLLVQPIAFVEYANALLYFLNYYGVSIVSVVFLIVFLSLSLKFKKRSRKSKNAIAGITLVSVITFEMLLIVSGIPDYISMLLSIPVATALYIVQFKPKTNLSKKRVTLLLALLITASSILPPATAYLCSNNIQQQALVKTPSEKASYISNLVAKTNFNPPKWFQSITIYLRLRPDFEEYTMTGVGACGEMAMSTTTFLNSLGLVARVVNFPGEDHTFVEVSLNGTWFVLDPGYYQGQILTREQRANNRLTEMGAISYVDTDVNSTSFIELTQNYVPTDTIVIRIVNNGEPVMNAQVYLEHTFLGSTWRLPDATHIFHSDSNGTVTLNMGSLDYNSNAGKVDSFYRIYVNGESTKYTVTSTGSNKTQFIEINLAK